MQRMFYIILVLITAGNSSAQEASLIVLKGFGQVGSDSNSVLISLENSVAVRGIQFTLSDVPNDLNVTAVSSTERTASFSTFSNSSEDGTLKVIQISLSGLMLEPGSGAIVEILFAVDQNATLGEHSLDLSDVIVADSSNHALPVTLVHGRFDVLEASGVEGEKQSPRFFNLLDVSPNPFTPETTLHYHLQRPGHVKVEIFNCLGQYVTTLVDAYQFPGSYQTRWAGLNETGQRVSAGVYLCILETAEKMVSQRITYLQ